MMITYDPIPGKIFDLIQVVQHGINKDSYDRVVALSGIAPDPAVVEAAQNVWQESDMETPGAFLLFSRNDSPECFMTHHYYGLLSGLASMEAFIDDFKGFDRQELKGQVLSFLDKENRDPGYYDSLIGDAAALYAFAEGLNSPSVLKWELLSLINNPEPLIDSVTALLSQVAERLNDIYRKNAKELDNFKQRIEAKIKQGTQLLQEEFGSIENQLSIDADQDVVGSCSFMNETTLTPLKQDGSLIVILGINYQKVLGTHYIDNDPINLDATLKALSDTARLKILQMLAIQDMYVAEIAQAIDKGMSTTSYHLDMLHYAGLVDSRTEGKRTYYILDRENFQKRLELLQKFVGVKS